MERRIRTNIPHAIPHRPSATRPDNPQNCNDQVSNNALHPRELHVKLLGRPGQLPQSLARHSIERSFNIVRKRCNSNDLNSMFEIVAGELRAKLGAVSAMRQVRSGRDTCAVATGPGRAASGRPTLQTSSNQRNSNRLTRTPVTNVVNPSPKTTIFSEKAIGLTTFVTTRTKPHAAAQAPPV